MYKYDIFREEIIIGSLEDFRGLMHEIKLDMPKHPKKDHIFLTGEQTPSDFPKNRARWELTLGEEFKKRGFILVRQLPNNQSKIQFANYSKFESIGEMFEIEFFNRVMNLCFPSGGFDIEKHREIGDKRKTLYENLTNGFNNEELRNIAFKLGFNHENFPERFESFVRELITLCERTNQIDELIIECEKERPHIKWQ